MKKVNVNIFNSKLTAAENSYNSAFGVITKIQKTSDAAAIAANDEMSKAEEKRRMYEDKVFIMKKKRDVYTSRSQKIANFIESLND